MFEPEEPFDHGPVLWSLRKPLGDLSNLKRLSVGQDVSCEVLSYKLTSRDPESYP